MHFPKERLVIKWQDPAYTLYNKEKQQPRKNESDRPAAETKGKQEKKRR